MGYYPTRKKLFWRELSEEQPLSDWTTDRPWQLCIRSGALLDALVQQANPRAFLDITYDDKPLGRIVLELFEEVDPRTAGTGEMGLGKQLGKPLHYKGSILNCVIPGLLIQGGDITKHDGTGGESIYGAEFEDENFKFKHDSPGLLSMANTGPHTNGSQFFLTTVKCPRLDDKYVVLGKVVQGFDDVVKKIERLGSESGETTGKIVIADCGQL